MIAVVADEKDHPVVKEFFELFKTPWEFYRSDGQKEVMICCGTRVLESSARLVLIYGSQETAFDREHGLQALSRRPNRVLSCDRIGRVPLYGECSTFASSSAQQPMDAESKEPAAVRIVSGRQVLVRIGYDLFHEIRHLLTGGQPLFRAMFPALDMHIACCALITGCSITLVEIPPIPAGFRFMACLTHDVDHVGVRNHKCDHTMFGFLYRATIGSVIHFFRGRKTAQQVVTNWRSAFALPLVHLGMARDFWYQFEHYLQLERGITSTFFVIPRKDDAGRDRNGANIRRAARYDAAELSDHLQPSVPRP
jgi:hypothetical protein